MLNLLMGQLVFSGKQERNLEILENNRAFKEVSRLSREFAYLYQICIGMAKPANLEVRY